MPDPLAPLSPRVMRAMLAG